MARALYGARHLNSGITAHGPEWWIAFGVESGEQSLEQPLEQTSLPERHWEWLELCGGKEPVIAPS